MEDPALMPVGAVLKLCVNCTLCICAYRVRGVLPVLALCWHQLAYVPQRCDALVAWKWLVELAGFGNA